MVHSQWIEMARQGVTIKAITGSSYDRNRPFEDWTVVH
jgi:hypothetical protein